MVAASINTVRTYTVPPRWLLDTASRHGLRVMVGLPWEQHVTFLDSPAIRRGIERRVRAGVDACAGHPAVLCYAVGNEIPAPIVRWHGAATTEVFLERLATAVRERDPGALVTYVNYPTTEYLDLGWADLLCFNVYLEQRDQLEAYLARLHNLAGERPLVLAEIGLDSRRHGETAQAEALRWQLRSVFAAGCAGAFAFKWTDEWHRGGFDIDDWDFGLTTRDRTPKPALREVRETFRDVPFPADTPWPRVSVAVCSYNAEATLEDTLQGLTRVEYPDWEVIVVDDGSTDTTARIASRFPCRLIRTENRGLSAARNTAWRAATGEIVAYLDSDAFPEPYWLQYLAAAFLGSEYVGVGGPNLPPPDDGWIAQCVANSPGGPVHVLLSDTEAEHLPGCNMAFRRRALEAVGGFDPRFRVAGDDVDICWQLQARGGTLGFHPCAVVWHHRRNSVRAYWSQQVGYGRAEALLERKWPQKYNRHGHIPWEGRLYGRGLPQLPFSSRGRIYQGMWGTAPFQSIYAPAPGFLSSLPLMPEWYLVIAALGAVAGLGTIWSPLLWALPLLATAVLLLLFRAVRGGLCASFPTAASTRGEIAICRTLTCGLHLLQPLARLMGRLRHNLNPWRRRGLAGFVWPRTRSFRAWNEHWREPSEWLSELVALLRDEDAVVLFGGDFDSWDLEARDGVLGSMQLRMTIEEHGGGKQLLRVRTWPRVSRWVVRFGSAGAVLALAALADGAWWVAGALLAGAAYLVIRAIRDCGAAGAALGRVLRQWNALEGRSEPLTRGIPATSGVATIPTPATAGPRGNGTSRENVPTVRIPPRPLEERLDIEAPGLTVCRSYDDGNVDAVN